MPSGSRCRPTAGGPRAAGADDPAADAAAQCHRGVEHHEKDGLAAMPPTRPLTCRNRCCDRFAHTDESDGIPVRRTLFLLPLLVFALPGSMVAHAAGQPSKPCRFPRRRKKKRSHHSRGHQHQGIDPKRLLLMK